MLAELDELAREDKDFRRGRVFGLVFHATDELEHALQAAHDRYLWHNALNPDAFPSMRRMQADVVSIAAGLFHGDEEAAGFMTSGGTESILLAVQAARVRALRERDIRNPNIVLPRSAHAAFDKACEYFGVQARRTQVRDDYRADLDALAAAIDDDTALVVGSAPQYPQGVIDPIPEIATLAAERAISCHVDACMGGFVLPFLERLGHALPAWDFRVPGVTSISADIHKYGYVPKGASVLIHRTKELRNDQTFVTDAWLGGVYGSSGVLGTKAGGPIAAAWASLQLLGEDGFCEQSARASRARELLVTGVSEIDGLRVLGEPELTMAAIAGDGVDVFAVHEILDRRGWHLDRQSPPDAIHATCMPVHETVMDDFIIDLRAAVGSAGSARAGNRATRYAKMD